MSKTEVISVNEKPESKMVNIVSRQTKNGNIVISLEDSQYFYLPFDKNIVDLSDNKTREQFIKSIEKQVRTSKLYKAYVSYLKVECGMEHCAVFGNVTSTTKSKTKVEMIRSLPPRIPPVSGGAQGTIWIISSRTCL